jgi:ESS family glutamate:Na+ symporter
MSFWESGLVLTGLWIGVLLLGASVLRRCLPPLQKLGIPDSIVAGMIGLVLGPGLLGLIPLDTGTLESIVYHGLAILFIAVSLQAPAQGKGGGGAVSYAFSIPVLALVQAAIGVLVVLGIAMLTGENTHPGFGLLLPLGFQQGPGQALSLGKAWEASGLVDGSQLGLIIASVGFAWAVLVGVPLVAIGRRLGWASDPGRGGEGADQGASESEPEPASEVGGLEPLSNQVVAIGAVYLLSYGAVVGLTSVLAGKPQIAAMLWGFHFIIGTLIALAIRSPWRRVRALPQLHDGQLGRVAGLTVDVMTCAALSAVSVKVLSDNLLPILVLTGLGGLATLVVVLWVARRAFPVAPFEHAVLLFGTATGTLPMGLALLRLLDPDLKGPSARSAVLGSAGALPLGAALLIVVLPYPVANYPDGFPDAVWAALGMIGVYLAILLVGWWKFGPLKLARPLLSLWPQDDDGS